jgi:hypothetical protein
VDRASQAGYTCPVVKQERTGSSRGRKKRGDAKERKDTRSAGALGSLGAAIGAVAVLGFLLYASCRGDDAAISAAPENALPRAEPQAAVTNREVPARAAPAPQAPQAEGWNDAQIAWLPYEAGLAKAKTDNKPVCLVFHTGWCPHCRNYSRVFQDPRIVAKARDFIMVRVNPDDEVAIGARHAPDGTYVPRTLFLAPSGEPLADVHAPRPQFIHFYDEHDAGSLLGGMEAALRKTARPM